MNSPNKLKNMNAEDIRTYALSFPDTEECFPFDEHTLVFKVAGKMFLLLALDEPPLRFNAKADKEKLISLREDYPDIILPGYHMSKLHWNTVICDIHQSTSFYKEIIQHSYLQVIAKFTKAKREEIMRILAENH